MRVDQEIIRREIAHNEREYEKKACTEKAEMDAFEKSCKHDMSLEEYIKYRNERYEYYMNEK